MHYHGTSVYSEYILLKPVDEFGLQVITHFINANQAKPFWICFAVSLKSLDIIKIFILYGCLITSKGGQACMLSMQL